MSETLVIQAGADWNRIGSATIAGVLTQVDGIVCQLRKTMSKDSVLVLDLAPFITQTTPGRPLISLSAEATSALEPTLSDQRYYIDMFGTIGGVVYKLIPTLPVIVKPFVSDDA